MTFAFVAERNPINGTRIDLDRVPGMPGDHDVQRRTLCDPPQVSRDRAPLAGRSRPGSGGPASLIVYCVSGVLFTLQTAKCWSS